MYGKGNKQVATVLVTKGRITTAILLLTLTLLTANMPSKHVLLPCEWYWLHPFNGLFFQDNPSELVPKRQNQHRFKRGQRRLGFWMQWQQLDHMQTICTSLQSDNHTNTSSVNFLQARCSSFVPSVLWHCWLGDRKGIRPVKTEWWGVGVVIWLERGADCLHIAQLMPLTLTVSCFSKIQTGFNFLVPDHPGSPRQRAAKQVYV